jgi:hypothetical protein
MTSSPTISTSASMRLVLTFTVCSIFAADLAGGRAGLASAAGRAAVADADAAGSGVSASSVSSASNAGASVVGAIGAGADGAGACAGLVCPAPLRRRGLPGLAGVLQVMHQRLVEAPHGRRAALERADELTEHIAAPQEQVEVPGGEAELPAPGLVEQRLGDMREAHDRGEVHEPGHALDRVERPEHRVDQLEVGQVRLEIEQRLLGVGDVLPGLAHELGAGLVDHRLGREFDGAVRALEDRRPGRGALGRRRVLIQSGGLVGSRRRLGDLVGGLCGPVRAGGVASPARRSPSRALGSTPSPGVAPGEASWSCRRIAALMLS